MKNDVEWGISEYYESYSKYKDIYPCSILNDRYFTSHSNDQSQEEEGLFESSDKLKKNDNLKFPQENLTCYCAQVLYVEIENNFLSANISLTVQNFRDRDEVLIFFGEKSRKPNKDDVKKGDSICFFREKNSHSQEVIKEEWKIIPFSLLDLLKFEKIKNETITNPIKECFVCKKKTKDFMKCGSCLAVRYCSQNCK